MHYKFCIKEVDKRRDNEADVSSVFKPVMTTVSIIETILTA